MAHDENTKRAATVLTIAQHKLKQALKKDDPEARLPLVSIELSSQFLSDVDAVLKQNTPANVQKCTGWIVKHIAPSNTRIAVLGDYLVSVSKSIAIDQQARTEARRAARSRFDLLLIVNDTLHTDKFHQRSAERQGIFGKCSASFVAELVELAASCICETETQAEKRLRAILNYWTINQLYGVDDAKALRDRADEALLVAQGGKPIRKRHYLLPEYHGDRNAPWYELPASYMLEHMIKHPDRPIDPSHIKVAKLDKKPVSGHVRKLLDNYFENIDLKHMPTGDNPTGETKKHRLRLDPMGQLVKHDKETGETTTVCNGYGWSTKLCQDMQKDGVPSAVRIAREEAKREEELDRSKESTRPQRDNRHYSRSPRRRERSSSASSYTMERAGRNRSRRSSRSSYDSRDSRSQSRNCSHSRHHVPSKPNRGRSNDHDSDRKYDENDRDQRRPLPRSYGRDSSKSGSQWNGPSPPNHTAGAVPSNNLYPTQQQNFGQGIPQPQVPFPPQMPLPPQFSGQFPMQNVPPPPPFQPGAFPGGVPPPPPPNYSGPFPTPPPNIAAMPNQQYNFAGNQYGNAFGNNFGYGNNQGFQQNQGNFQGGGRGGQRGHHQGGGHNRGGYNNSQRGQRGGRW